MDQVAFEIRNSRASCQTTEDFTRSDKEIYDQCVENHQYERTKCASQWAGVSIPPKIFMKMQHPVGHVKVDRRRYAAGG